MNSNPLKDFLVHPLLCVLSDTNLPQGGNFINDICDQFNKMGVGKINVIKNPCILGILPDLPYQERAVLCNSLMYGY